MGKSVVIFDVSRMHDTVTSTSHSPTSLNSCPRDPQCACHIEPFKYKNEFHNDTLIGNSDDTISSKLQKEMLSELTPSLVQFLADVVWSPCHHLYGLRHSDTAFLCVLKRLASTRIVSYVHLTERLHGAGACSGPWNNLLLPDRARLTAFDCFRRFNIRTPRLIAKNSCIEVLEL